MSTLVHNGIHGAANIVEFYRELCAQAGINPETSTQPDARQYRLYRRLASEQRTIKFRIVVGAGFGFTRHMPDTQAAITLAQEIAKQRPDRDVRLYQADKLIGVYCQPLRA